jgi:molybdate transport system ATP-binding protein
VADRALAVSLRQGGPIPLDVAFTCHPGQVLAIFGPSGSGKTTILRSIAGLSRPAQARVRCGDQMWVDTDTGRALPVHRRPVGFVFQDYALFPHLTAVGNVTAALGHLPRGARRARAEHLLRLVHLSSHLDRRPGAMSGGERQRVALARALARDPAVLLLDEPFAAVDRSVRRHLQDEIDQIRRSLDIPLILVTHDFGDVIRLATDLLLLDHGAVVAHGPLDALTSRPDLTWLRESVGLGSFIEARVATVNASRGLAELAFDGGTLLAPSRSLTEGMRVRLRIPAREVILATEPPRGLSLRNILSGVVSSMHVEAGDDHVVVQVAVGDVRLLAEVTRDAVAQLGIAPGVALHALVKSVSLDAVATPTADHPASPRA